MASVFDSYCIVCDKQLHDTHELYCSSTCKHKDAGVSPHMVKSSSPSPRESPKYPSVFDNYMNGSHEYPVSDEELEVFSLPPRDGASASASLSRQSVLSYQISLQSGSSYW